MSIRITVGSQSAGVYAAQSADLDTLGPANMVHRPLPSPPRASSERGNQMLLQNVAAVPQGTRKPSSPKQLSVIDQRVVLFYPLTYAGKIGLEGSSATLQLFPKQVRRI